ncbi:MAG: AraC family transcriptional regulator [Candidatus Acidiferrales bacterium]
MPLLGYSLTDPVDRNLPPHSHSRGQLFSLRSGLVNVKVESGTWVLPPHGCAWIPPRQTHSVRTSGPVVGWCIFVLPSLCAGLPAQPCVLAVSGLLRALIDRFAAWRPGQSLTPPDRRLVKVFQDELAAASVQRMHLPVPKDERLTRILDALGKEPDDTRTIAEWARWSAMSKRTLTRSFVKETGMTFARWRQQARLFAALERLSKGESVTDVAVAVGYRSVSAFIDVFRQSFGVTPGAYLGDPSTHRISHYSTTN